MYAILGITIAMIGLVLFGKTILIGLLLLLVGSLFYLHLRRTRAARCLKERWGDIPVLQPQADQVTKNKNSNHYYIPSTTDTINWGYLPNRNSQPVLTVRSGATVTFDTVSHEGILEDQGRNPVAYFQQHGIDKDHILTDAIAISRSDIPHDFDKDGPHVITGPVAIEGAKPGDILKVEILSLTPRVPYGVISNRHGLGALVGEYPKVPREADASAAHPDRYHNVSVFTQIEKTASGYEGVIATESGQSIRFPLSPFMGILGVAQNTDRAVNSNPPTHTGGNIDINDLGEGATVYLPIEVAGGLFYTGDSHFSQGDGEVALTALEGSLRATFKLTLLKSGEAPGLDIQQPLGATADFWIALGLDPDLDEAMKKSTREAVRFLNQHYGIEEHLALAYLSAATTFEVSQVVDQTKGIHAMIRKADFSEFEPKGK